MFLYLSWVYPPYHHHRHHHHHHDFMCEYTFHVFSRLLQYFILLTIRQVIVVRCPQLVYIVC